MHSEKSAKSLRIGVVHTAAHAKLPWSEKRWQFVLTRMQQACDGIWIGDIGKLGLLAGWLGKAKVSAQATLFEGYRDILPRMAQLSPTPKLFAQPQRLCNSFSKFYEQAQKGERDFSRLLQLPQQTSLL